MTQSPMPGRGFATWGGKAPRWSGIGLLALLCLLPYANALRAGFVYDDIWLIARHPAVSGPFDLGTILMAPYWGMVKMARLWRPLTTLSFAIDWRIGGGAPFWPHLVNLFLHTGVTFLLAFLVKRLSGRQGLALAAAALFAVHPIHTEAVTWVSGRAELLAALFGLVAIHLALSSSPRLQWIAPVAVLMAMGSKEIAVTIPAVLLYLSWAFPGKIRRPLLLFAACAASVFVYVLLRRMALGTWEGPATDPTDNPMVRHDLIARLPTVLDTAGRYLALFLWPARLSLDYSAPVLSLVRGLTAPMIVGIVALAGLIWLAIRRRGQPEGWGSALALFAFALPSNLLYVIGTIFAERLFYLPSAGLLVAMVAIAHRIESHRPIATPVLRAVLAVVVVAASARTWIRNQDFSSEEILYKVEAKVHPTSPKMRYNLAVQMNREGRYDDGIREAVEAIRLDPANREPRDVLVTALEKLGRAEEAVTFLRNIMEQDPGDQRARRNLLRLLDASGRSDEADSLAHAGLRNENPPGELHAIAARRAQDRGDFASAIALWRGAAAGTPESIDAPIYLGFCLLKSGDAPGARDAYAEALRRDPRSADAANGLAWCLLETGAPPSEAVRLAGMAVRLSPTAYFYDTLARAQLAAGGCDEARRAAARAVSMDSTNADFRQRLREVEERCR